MSEKGNGMYDIYDAPDAETNKSGNNYCTMPIGNGTCNVDSSYCGVTDHTYEGLNRNKSVNKTYDTLQYDQDQDHKIKKNPKKTYIIVGIICFLVGSVLAGSVVFVLMRSKSSSDDGQPKQPTQAPTRLVKLLVTTSDDGKTDSGNGMKLDLKLDRSTLHSTKYMSNDGLILRNRYSDRTPLSGAKELNKDTSYKGASGNIYMKNNDVIYYEVSFEYTLRKVLSATNLILEVGLADRNVLLTNEFVGNVENGWSFAIARCGGVIDSICIRAKHNGILSANKKFSANQNGNTVKGNFEVMINMKSRTFCLSATGAHLYTFENISSGAKLYPVFAAYSFSTADVRLNISNATDLTSLPNNNKIKCHL